MSHGWPSTVIITGASGGLGSGLARSYARPGCCLGLIGRDPFRLAAVAEDCRRLGATVREGLFDLNDLGATAAWLREFDAASPVDLLIANAGISAGTRPDGTLEGIEAAVTVARTNLLGVLHSVEPLLPEMLARRRGQIAVVASVAAYRGLPDSPAYCASKAGVRLYGESLRAALKPRGIAVTVIVPGFFSSPMSERFIGRRHLLVSAEAAVTKVRRGLDRRSPRVVFPRRLALVLRVADLLPAAFGDRLMRAAPFHIEPESQAREDRELVVPTD